MRISISHPHKTIELVQLNAPYLSFSDFLTDNETDRIELSLLVDGAVGEELLHRSLRACRELVCSHAPTEPLRQLGSTESVCHHAHSRGNSHAMRVIGVVVPALNSVTESVPEIENEALTSVEFVMLNNVALNVNACIDDVINDLVNIAYIVRFYELEKLFIANHSLFYSLSHTARELSLGQGRERIAVAYDKNRLLECTYEVLAAWDINSSFASDR